MNKNRRKHLNEIKERLEELSDIIQGLADEERETVDNLPENLHGTDRALEWEENADRLDGLAQTLAVVRPACSDRRRVKTGNPRPFQKAASDQGGRAADQAWNVSFQIC